MDAENNGDPGRTVAPSATYDLAAERSVLGAMLLDPAAVPSVSFLVAEDFFLTRHVAIFRSIVAVHSDAGVSDPISVANELRRRGLYDEVGGLELLLDLLDGSITAIGVEHHARIVQEKAKTRSLIATMREAIIRARDGDDLDAVVEDLSARLKQRPVDRSEYRSASWEELAAGSPQEWLIPNWVPEKSTGIMFGESTTGKSFVAIDMSARMVTGRKWFGLDMVSGPVLYLAGEGHDGLGGRVTAWRAHHGGCSDAYPLDVIDGVPPLERSGRAIYMRLVEDFVAKHGVPPAMVWIDTWAQGLPGDENSAEAVGPALRIMSDMRRLYGCSVWAIAHPRKPSAGDESRPLTVHDLRGHGSLRGNMDGLIGVEMGSGEKRVLTALKVKDGIEGSTVPFRLLIVKTGRRHRNGAEETSCVVTPAEAEAVMSQAEIEREADAKHQAAMTIMVDRVVDELRALGSATSKTAVCLGVRGKRELRFAAFDRAVASGRILNTGTTTAPYFSIPPETAP